MGTIGLQRALADIERAFVTLQTQEHAPVTNLDDLEDATERALQLMLAEAMDIYHAGSAGPATRPGRQESLRVAAMETIMRTGSDMTANAPTVLLIEAMSRLLAVRLDA